jgi:hypothetical protein
MILEIWSEGNSVEEGKSVGVGEVEVEWGEKGEKRERRDLYWREKSLSI